MHIFTWSKKIYKTLYIIYKLKNFVFLTKHLGIESRPKSHTLDKIPQPPESIKLILIFIQTENENTRMNQGKQHLRK
jgi:hypothetical protein